MANKKRKRNPNNQRPNNKGYQSSYSKGTKMFVLFLAFLMIASALITMVFLLVDAIVGDDHDDHDHSSSVIVSSSSNAGTSDNKPTGSTSSGSSDDVKKD